MSLRARLIIGLLALAAVGLVLLAGVTYVEQRNFLLDRVDQQVKDASQFRGGPMLGDGPFSRFGNVEPDGGRGPGGPAAGTCMILRAADARTTLRWSCQTYDSSTEPTFPADLPTGRLTTVDATNSDTTYRLLAQDTAVGVRITAVPLTETHQTLSRLLRIEAVVIAAILVALGALAWWLVRIGLRPLDRMGATAGAIAAGDLSHRVEPATPRTEVGRLGLALNRMLDRLEKAFAERKASEDRLRTFLADASHELRTPLASIRGYAELFRIGAARDPENIEKAMSRIEAEAARMGVLVEDLLTLARLDEVRDAIRVEVDVSRLAGDAVDDARATAPDRDIDLYADAHAVVVGDPYQLRQVLANLLRNALVHTPAGTPVQVSVQHDDGGVLLEVRDHGPGIAGEDAATIFERFWRAEGGRERGRAGAGLGLAIVAGIVHAHGGAVRAENAAGGGARFVVQLPARPAPVREAVPAA